MNVCGKVVGNINNCFYHNNFNFRSHGINGDGFESYANAMDETCEADHPTVQQLSILMIAMMLQTVYGLDEICFHL